MDPEPKRLQWPKHWLQYWLLNTHTDTLSTLSCLLLVCLSTHSDLLCDLQSLAYSAACFMMHIGVTALTPPVLCFDLDKSSRPRLVTLHKLTVTRV